MTAADDMKRVADALEKRRLRRLGASRARQRRFAQPDVDEKTEVELADVLDLSVLLQKSTADWR